MSNQTKVTDFFATQKKSDKSLRSAKKLTQSLFDPNLKTPITESSTVEETDIPTVKTPKRKKETTNSKVLRSSKRKKTPKCNVAIELETIGSESNDKQNTKKSDKQLSAKEVKEKLIGCKNLLKLKQQLSTINDCVAKIKKFKEIKVRTPTKKPIGTPTKNKSPYRMSPIRPLLANTPITPIIPPLKSPMRVMPNKNSDCVQTYRRRLFDVFEDESPKKSDKKATQRSFERYSYLLDKPEENQTLVLPLKYKVLADMFKAMDTIVSMHYKRHEVSTFDKVKDSVERMINKKFDIKRLAQIQTIFSGAFKLKYEMFSSILNRKPTHQLIISPIYNSNVDIRLSSTHLLERYQAFVDRLLDITKRHHRNYLNNLGISINDELYRWHPKFNLDSVPDIEPNDNALPIEPKLGEHSAETFLESSRQRLGITSTKNEQKTSDANEEQKVDNRKSMDSTEKITKGVLKGISVDLLKKIRAKEAANLAQEMTRKPEVERELRILSSLPEFIRIIHSYLVGSNKLSVPYEQLVDKVISSFNVSMSVVRAKEHIDFLCDLFPDWIALLQVKRGTYVKINKQTPIATLDQRIGKKVSQLKKCQQI